MRQRTLEYDTTHIHDRLKTRIVVDGYGVLSLITACGVDTFGVIELFLVISICTCQQGSKFNTTFDPSSRRRPASRHIASHVRAICILSSALEGSINEWTRVKRDTACTTRMHSQVQALILLLLCSLLAGAAIADPGRDPTYKDCHPGDKATVLAITAALGQPDEPGPANFCCDWYDVSCDDHGRVVGLYLFQQPDLAGTIPDAVGDLTHLQDLLLHKLPGLSGHIPPAIARLSNLTMLRIFWTGVSGPVPPFLGALKRLTFLDLSFNSLTGAIPASLGTIPNLSGINLSRNRLTGPIPPPFLSESADQVYIWLSHNNLTGPIPAQFAAVRFAHLDLSRNALTGDASGLFGRGKELGYLDLSRNGFDFDLSGVVFPEQLGYLDVSHNAIRGSIPAQAADLTYVREFNFSYNRLCGALPTGGGGRMIEFDLYSLQHNKCLCGAPLFAPCKK